MIVRAVVAASVALTAPPEPIAAPDPGPNIVVPVLHDLALMSVMRGVETVLWPDPFARSEHFGAHYGEAFSKPPLFDAQKPWFRWDGDPWSINVVGHALFGSELYLRARMCRFSVLGAAGATLAASTLWEYGFEANGVRPSAFDLVYTPVSGALLGEARHALFGVSKRLGPGAAAAALRAVADPLGELERAAGAPC